MDTFFEDYLQRFDDLIEAGLMQCLGCLGRVCARQQLHARIEHACHFGDARSLERVAEGQH